MINFGGLQVNKKAAAQVEKWVRKQLLAGVLATDPQLHVLAKEVRCNEPDCVPIETLVILVSSLPVASTEDGARSWRWTGKVLKPMAEVTERDVLMMELPLSMEEQGGQQEEQEEEQLKTDESEGAVGEGEEVEDASREVSAAAGAGPKATGETPPAAAAGVSTAQRPGKTAPKSVFRLNAADPETQKQEQKEAHKKGVRPRGCPCCDPDNLDNIIDNFMFNI